MGFQSVLSFQIQRNLRSRAGGVRFPFAKRIEAMIAGYDVNPRRHPRVAAERIQASEYLEKYLLRQIQRGLTVSRHRIAPVHNPRVIAIEDLFEKTVNSLLVGCRT